MERDHNEFWRNLYVTLRMMGQVAGANVIKADAVATVMMLRIREWQMPPTAELLEELARDVTVLVKYDLSRGV